MGIEIWAALVVGVIGATLIALDMGAGSRGHFGRQALSPVVARNVVRRVRSRA